MKQTSQMPQSPVPQTLPVNPINPFNPMMQPPNQMMQPFPMMNQPLFIDPMGRLMMLVPFNPLQMPRDPNQQQSLPQGPPIPIQGNYFRTYVSMILPLTQFIDSTVQPTNAIPIRPTSASPFYS